MTSADEVKTPTVTNDPDVRSGVCESRGVERPEINAKKAVELPPPQLGRLLFSRA